MPAVPAPVPSALAAPAVVVADQQGLSDALIGASEDASASTRRTQGDTAAAADNAASSTRQAQVDTAAEGAASRMRRAREDAARSAELSELGAELSAALDAAQAANQRWSDAVLAAALFAIDPAGVGGVHLRAHAGPVRDRWLAVLRAALPAASPLRRVPLNVTDGRLLGGLDLTATLQAGRPIAERGLLAESHGGVVLLAMAERVSAAAAGRLTATLDAGEVLVERDGLALRAPACLGVVALDEGTEDERPPPALCERLAFEIDLSTLAVRDALEDAVADVAEIAAARAAVVQGVAAQSAAVATTGDGAMAAIESTGTGSAVADALRRAVAQARADLAQVQVSDQTLMALCGVAYALGIASLRAPIMALRVACAAAALAGRTEVTAEDAQTAARLVYAARATQLPASSDEALDADRNGETEAEIDPEPDTESDAEPKSAPGAETDAPPSEPPQDDAGVNQDAPPPPPPPPDATPDAPPDATPPEGAPQNDRLTDRALADVLLEAAIAAMPADLLAQLSRMAAGSGTRAGGRGGVARANGTRGRPAGVRRGEPGGAARLSVVETLRAAAPWQALRRRERHADATDARGTAAVGAAADARGGRLIQVRRDDFRVVQHKQRTRTTTVFIVDASGSSALARLGEIKGAVELLLADCYVRRDEVALIAFRGQAAQVLLPPTRSLARAKRSLAALPGGGGTPLAAGLQAAGQLAGAIARKGDQPMLVLLTDGRPNVARGGVPGRAAAEADARAAALALRLLGFQAVLVDTALRPQAFAQSLAVDMGARYLALPQAGAQSLSRAILASTMRPATR